MEKRMVVHWEAADVVAAAVETEEVYSLQWVVHWESAGAVAPAVEMEMLP